MVHEGISMEHGGPYCQNDRLSSYGKGLKNVYWKYRLHTIIL